MTGPDEQIREFPFPWPDENKGYSLFSPKYEQNELIAFHGTNEENLKLILDEGFRFVKALPSVSFAKESALALRYASEARTLESPRGCVIVVQFSEPIPRAGVDVEASIIYVRKLDEMPKVIGFCVIPEDYKFS